MTTRAEEVARGLYRKMSNTDLLTLAYAFEADVKNVSQSDAVEFAVHRLVLIAEVIAERST